jgi:hypothetical protein
VPTSWHRRGNTRFALRNAYQRDLVGRLAKAGIFVEATGQVRHRRFRYDLYSQLVLVAHHQPKVIVSFALAASLVIGRQRVGRMRSLLRPYLLFRDMSWVRKAATSSGREANVNLRGEPAALCQADSRKAGKLLHGGASGFPVGEEGCSLRIRFWSICFNSRSSAFLWVGD